MAKQKTTAADTSGPTAEFDQEATYRVALTRSVQIGRAKVHPGPRVLLRGDVLTKLIGDDPDAVEGYETFNV